MLLIHVLVIFVRRVGIYFHGFVFPETCSESIGQQGVRHPNIPFDVEIEASPSVIVDFACGIVMITILGSVSVGRRMGWWSVLLGNADIRMVDGFK